MTKVLTVLLLVVATGLAEDEDIQQEYNIYKDAVEFVDECGSKELSLCFKERAFRYLETIPNDLDLGGGVKIKPNENRNSRQHDPVVLPEEPRAREETLEDLLWNKLAEYLSTHTLEFKVPTDTIHDLKRSMEEGRGKGGGGGGKGGKKGGGGGMQTMMMLIQLKAAIVGAIALKVIGIVAFKALLVAKIALTLSLIIALKKLLEQKHHTSTYEVVAHPHHDEYSHFDRSFTPDQLAYRAHDPVHGHGK